MAVIPITIPDNIINRVSEGLGWTSELGVTRAEFFKQFVARKVREEVSAHETSKAAGTAIASARASVETEIIIT